MMAQQIGTVRHVMGGYCANGERLEADVRRVVEPKDAIRPDPVLRWTWVDDLCPTCRVRGGVGLFNRAVEERKRYDEGAEPLRVIQDRALRLSSYEEAEGIREAARKAAAARKAEREERRRLAATPAGRLELKRRRNEARALRRLERAAERAALFFGGAP